MKNVAVILSGCGVFDGAEIHESVLTLMNLEKQQCSYQCFAPNVAQHHVINHLTGEEMPESRNVLIESARIARGEVKDLATIDHQEFDALVLPGGFGAAKNLSDFAFKGADCQVNADVVNACQQFHQANKPIGFICIAPAMIPKIFGEKIQLTIGTDAQTAEAIEAMGGDHVACTVDSMVVDDAHKIISTPAYMLAGSISEANSGIEKLVKKLVEMS